MPPRAAIPDRVWSTWSLDYETRFSTEPEFQTQRTTEWAVAELTARGLASLFSPAAPLVRERQVRLFYRHLTYDCTSPDRLSTTVDGITFSFTPADIGRAVDCPHECPLHDDGTPRYAPLPSDLTVTTMVDTMCEGRYANDHRNCPSRSSLPPQMWLVDSVLQRNACPLGHKVQRRGEFLHALFATHQGYWFSAPGLIWSQLYKVWENKIAKRTQGAATWALPFPALITRLLELFAVPLPDADETTTRFPVFGLAQWNQSLSHMTHQPHYIRFMAGGVDDEEEAVDAAAGAGPPQSPHFEAPVPDAPAAAGSDHPITRAEYEILRREHAEIRDILAAIQRTQDEILRHLHQPPPPPT